MMRYSRFSAADDTSPAPNALTARATFNEFRAAGVEVGWGGSAASWTETMIAWLWKRCWVKILGGPRITTADGRRRKQRKPGTRRRGETVEKTGRTTDISPNTMRKKECTSGLACTQQENISSSFQFPDINFKNNLPVFSFLSGSKTEKKFQTPISKMHLHRPIMIITLA